MIFKSFALAEIQVVQSGTFNCFTPQLCCLSRVREKVGPVNQQQRFVIYPYITGVLHDRDDVLNKAQVILRTVHLLY